MNEIFDIQQLTQFEFGAIILTVFVAGLVFGCLVAWGLLNRKSSPKTVAAEKTKEEFEQYKDKVDEHFTQTSAMFKDVTTQYKKLYDHIAVGAVSLGNSDTIAMPRLEMKDSDQDSQMAVEKPDADQTEDVVENTPVVKETPEQDSSSQGTIGEEMTETLEEVDGLVEKQIQEKSKIN